MKQRIDTLFDDPQSIVFLDCQKTEVVEDNGI
jgi:hypothetical protein